MRYEPVFVVIVVLEDGLVTKHKIVIIKTFYHLNGDRDGNRDLASLKETKRQQIPIDQPQTEQSYHLVDDGLDDEGYS